MASRRQDVECRASASVASGELLEKVEPFLEVEGGFHVQIEAKLHDRESHVGLYPDDHGFGPAKTRSMSEIP